MNRRTARGLAASALAATVALIGVMVALRLPAPGGPAAWQAEPPSGAVAGEAPNRLRIPAIGVDADLVELRLDSAGALEPPADYHLPGWYAAGTAPGDIGPAVIAGHVDSRTGPAVFHRLSDLKTGDVVQVQRGRRWIDFEVTAGSRHPKDDFPAAAVYGPTPDAQLRLITCGGTFDRARDSYRDNLVVYAIIRSDV